MKTQKVFGSSLKTLIPLSLGSMLFSASAGMAQEINSSVIVSADAVNYYFNDDKGQNHELGYQFGLEVPLSQRWSLDLKYLDVNSKLKNRSAESDVDFVHAGPRYNFNPVLGFQPYAGAGIGDLTITRPGQQDFNSTTFNMNVGVKYLFGSNWMGKVEAMMIEPTGSVDNDLALSASIGYALGRRASRATPSAFTQEVMLDQRNLDSDGDGVIDANDDCPNTSPSLAVDAFGCVILDADQRRQLLQVRFDFDQSVIKDEYQAEIEDFAVFLRRYSETSAVIEGHTDSTGPDAYNQALSERRALAVMNALVTRYGVDPARLSIVGYGESNPVASNRTALGRQENRRIEADVSVQVFIERQR